MALLAEPFAERAAQLGLSGEAQLEYRPRTRAVDEDAPARELRERLDSDLERGFSGHGPHRDELALLRDGRELRSYGSQGEQRLALLALLLAERTVLARERARMPLMLLDDVMSELDAERRELLARELATGGQSVIATTDLAHVPGAAGRWRHAAARLARRGAPGGAGGMRQDRPTRRPMSRLAPRRLATPVALTADARAGDHACARAGDVGARRRPGDRRLGPPNRRARRRPDGDLRGRGVGAGARADGSGELIGRLNAALGDETLRELRCRSG